MTATDKPLKAYAVLDDDERTGFIYFARHAIVATRAGADELADGEISHVECRRAPWADAYAETGTVPASALIDNGWHWECSGCSTKIDEDSLADMGLTSADVIGDQRSAVYCCASCRDADKARRARRAEIERNYLDMMNAIILKRFPDAMIHISEFGPRAGWGDEDAVITSAVVNFFLPGLQHRSTLRLADLPWQQHGPRQLVYFCAAVDREAFEARAEATRCAA